MAQVTARKRGKTWEYRFETATVEGKRRQKSKGGFKTKAEAMKAGREAMHLYDSAGILPASSSMSYADFLQKWLDEDVVDKVSISTYTSYRGCVKNHIIPALGEYRLIAVTHSAMQAVIDLKPYSTAQLVKTVFHLSMRYAYSVCNLIQHNPAQNLRIPRNAPKAKSRSRSYEICEVQPLLDELKGDPAYYAVIIALHTGMRIGELFALSWDCVDFDARKITVKQGLTNKKQVRKKYGTYRLTDTKTERSHREITFGDTLYNVFLKMKNVQQINKNEYGEYWHEIYVMENEELLSKPIALPAPSKRTLDAIMRTENGSLYTEATMYNRLKQASKKLGVDYKFHNFRDTHATLLIERGVSPKTVQDRLGHVDISTTFNRYVNVTDKMQTEAVHEIEKAWTNGGQDTESQLTKHWKINN